MALQTIQSKNLQRITTSPYAALTNLPDISTHPQLTFRTVVWETVRREWQDLDRPLVQLWTSHSVRPRITYEVGRIGNYLGAFLPSLLPVLTRRGLVDLVEYSH